jgi:ribose 5-phosphate isomerase
VEENCASTTSNTRPEIEIDDADEIIKTIVTPKGFGAEAQRERNRKIIRW